jgi:putative transposase
MGLEAIYPKPKLRAVGRGHRNYPYLLRNVSIERADQVWSTDITYVPLASGFMYLAAILDWFSRYGLAWRLSNTLDGFFCNAAGQGKAQSLTEFFSLEAASITLTVEEAVLAGGFAPST